LEKPSKVCVDTSMLLCIAETKVRFFEDVKMKLGRVGFYVPSCVEKEIVSLEKSQRLKIAVVRKVLDSVEVKKIDCEGKADDCLVELSKQGFIVATNDSELRKRIKGFGGRIIYLKKSTFIEFG